MRATRAPSIHRWHAHSKHPCGGPGAKVNTQLVAVASGNPDIAGLVWNHIGSTRGSEEDGMETMKVHVLERALTAACVVAAIAVIWWGFKILAA